MENTTKSGVLPEEVPQEELVMLESSVAEDQLNTEPSSNTESAISTPEGLYPNEPSKELSTPPALNNKIQIGFIEKIIYTIILPTIVIGG